jgi:hypothetical protein
MNVHCFTSISLSYLAKARVLGESLRRFHPEWTLWLCISDREPEEFTFDIANEPFDRVLWVDEVDFPDRAGWIFQHDVVELCTAVKGEVLEELLREGADRVIYLDPDIAVFARLDPLLDLLDKHPVILTPHQLEAEDTDAAVIDNEVGTLSTGVFNLGFLGVRNCAEGRRFAGWWNKRLQGFCYDERARGIFVDQKWCNLVPVLFDGVGVVRDPGYNVASWNLSNRKLSISEAGDLLVNGSPLRFFHFTKLGPIGDTMTQRYARDNVEVYELWAWYKRMVDRHTSARIPPDWWYFGRFESGTPIPRSARELYRNRADLRQAFPDPFSEERGGYCQWLRQRALL